MHQITRRDFLPMTAGIFTASSYAKIMKSNSRVNVGFIGTGGMGQANMNACKNQLNANISWVCDVYDAHLDKARQIEPSAKTTKDFRRVLDDKETDAVCISTPDHWHALMTIEAFKSGKDVYCEKPIAHRVNEIKLMIRACEKYKKIFQSGQWQHSGNQFLHAIDILQKRKFGKIIKADTWFYSGTENMKYHPDSMPPPGLDWNMWLGPAPLRPFNHNRFIFNFRWFWDYANGMFGDWLPHMTDIAEWGMQSNKLKQDVRGPFYIKTESEPMCVSDGRETPTTFRVEYGFDANTKLVAEYNGCAPPKDGVKRDWGIEWTCEGGTIFVDRELCLLRNSDRDLISTIKTDNRAGSEHWHDFIECVISRKETRASLNIVARTNVNCLLAAAVHRYHTETGANDIFRWDPKKMKAIDKKIGRYLEFNYRAPWKLTV